MGWIPLLLGGAMLLLSVRLGPDATWDLRNYHLYDADAALRKPAFRDLVPAQMQSFNPPTIDLPSLWLRFRLNHWPNLLDALLALPSAAATALAWLIGRRLLPARGGNGGFAPSLSLTLAVAFGATGAAGLPTIGTSMSEMPAGCFALAGLLLLLDALDGSVGVRLPFAGALFGVAVALKLTMAMLGLSALAALAVCGTGGPVRRIGRTALFATGLAAGLAAVAGPWWWHLAALTGNPLFPFFNGVFRSPLLPAVSIGDTRFLPRSLGEAIAYPFVWGFTQRHVVAELTLRDPRLAVALLAGLCCALPPWRGLGRRGACLLVFCGTGFVLWEAQFSILRYLAPIELLSGLTVLLALRRLAPPAAVPALMAAILLACAAFTIYPDWGRASPADTAASVTLPPLPADAMVLLLSGDPMAYVAAFAAPTIRFVGIDNNLVRPGDRSLLAQRIERAVRDHPGPLFGLEVPDANGSADAALRHYGLRRVLPCGPVRTNLERDGLRLCRLTAR